MNLEIQNRTALDPEDLKTLCQASGEEKSYKSWVTT
jgi:hypothetical protein